MRKNKVLKVISGSLTWILFGLLIFMVFVVISSKASGGEPKVFGYQLKTVLSGSMEPTFDTGSIIAIKPLIDTTNLKKDDVITFLQQDGAIITHRIIEVIKQEDQVLYQTKGDNNEDPDVQPILSQNVLGKYSGFTIPYLGYFVNYTKSGIGAALLLIIPGVLLLIYSGFTILKALKEIEPVTKKEDTKTSA